MLHNPQLLLLLSVLSLGKNNPIGYECAVTPMQSLQNSMLHEISGVVNAYRGQARISKMENIQHLVDLEKMKKLSMNNWLQKSASIQPRTDLSLGYLPTPNPPWVK